MKYAKYIREVKEQRRKNGKPDGEPYRLLLDPIEPATGHETNAVSATLNSVETDEPV